MKKSSTIADNAVHRNRPRSGRISSGNRSGNDSEIRDGNADALPSAYGHPQRWPCGCCGTGTSSTCHGTWPFAVVECVVSRWETSVDALDATSILLSICSSVRLRTRNSRRQFEIDLCTAQTRNGNKSQNTVRMSVTSTAIIPMIPSSDIALTRSSIGLCGNGVLLLE